MRHASSLCSRLLGVVRMAACVCCLLPFIVGSVEEEERLIGWRGDTFRHAEAPAAPPRPQRQLRQRPIVKDRWVQTLSWKPRAALIHNFISAEEAQHIAELAWPRMQRSVVVGEHNKQLPSEYRTSYGAFLYRHETPTLARIQNRVAVFTRVPVYHQEDIQVLRYGTGQFYRKHMDNLDDVPGFHRMATLLIYLADAEEGGETSFPEDSEWSNPKLGDALGAYVSDCAKGHVAVRPRRGDALLFYTVFPNGTALDPHSVHEGCPVLKGSKWTTTVWVHSRPFHADEWNGHTFVQSGHRRGKSPTLEPGADGLCQDSDVKSCAKWTSGRSDCTSYMKARCRASCKLCEPCGVEDTESKAPCFWHNRVANDFLAFDPSELSLNLSRTGDF